MLAIRKHSLRFQILMVSLIVLPVLFAAAAVTVYVLSFHQVKEEHADQMNHLGQQVMGNVASMFEQAEKIAVMISNNQQLLDQLSSSGEPTVTEQLEKMDYVESTLRSMILSSSYIETVYISLRNGETYLYSYAGGLTTPQIRSLNAFQLRQFQELSQGYGVWQSPYSGSDHERARAEDNPTYRRILGERFVYTSQVNENMRVTITIDPWKIEKMLAREHSGYTYEVRGLSPGDEKQNLEYALYMTHPSYGFALHVVSDPTEIKEQAGHTARILLAVVTALFGAVAGSAYSFSRRVVAPFEWLKRQVSDIEKSNLVDDIIHYKLRRKVPASIRAKIFIHMMSVCGLGFMVILAVNYSCWTRVIEDQMKDYIFEYLYQSQNSIELNMKNSEQFSSSILLSGKLQELLENETDKTLLAEELKKLFSYHHIISKNIDYLNIYDSQGNLVFSTIQSLLNEEPIHQRNIYPLLEQSAGETVYYNELQDPFGDHVLAIGKKINSITKPGTLLGYLLIAVNEQEFYLSEDDLGIPSLNVIVIDETGNVMHQKREDPVVSEIANFHIRLDSDKGMYPVRAGGRDILLFYGPLENTQWTVVSTIDAAEIDSGQKQMVLLYGCSLMIMTAVILGVIYWAARSITGPVDRLMLNIRGVIKDEFKGFSFRRIAGPDEIAELSEHIYAMIRKIQRLMSDLVEYEIKTREIQLEFQKAELSHLIQQINPHFLYNTLETIKWMTMELTGGENKASLMLNELARFLRYGVHTDQKRIPLADELSHVRAYLYIQTIRYGDKLQVKWMVEPGTEQMKIIRFTLQPIVENALIHGIDSRKKRWVLLIEASVQEGMLALSVTDNGVGMDEEKIKEIGQSFGKDENNHIGLSNIRQRLALTYGEQAAMVIRSKPRFWTQVRIELPVQVD